MFSPLDAEAIPAFPLCKSWPTDKLIWHYNSIGAFSVPSAYHLIMEDTRTAACESTTDDSKP